MEVKISVNRTFSGLMPGDHLCCIYDGASQYRHTLVAFLCDGLRLGQRVVYLYPNHDPKPLLSWISKTGLDVDQAMASGQLVLRDCVEIFGPPAAFDPDAAYQKFQALLQSLVPPPPLTPPAPLMPPPLAPVSVRVAVDMRWAVLAAEGPSTLYNPRLAEFEQQITDLGSAAIILCLYDAAGRPDQCSPHAVAAHHGCFDASQTSGFSRLLSTGRLPVQLGAEKELADAHAALAETETRYRAIFNASTEAILIYDLEGRVLDVNLAAYERLGYTQSEMIGQQADFIEAPELCGQFTLRADLVRKYGAITFETVHMTRAAQMVPVEVNARLIDYDGRQVMLSIARDITDRKHAELALVNVNQALASANEALNATNAALRESELKFRSLVESSPDGVTLIDTNGRLIEFNQANETIFGLSAAEVLGTRLADFFQDFLVADRDKLPDRAGKPDSTAAGRMIKDALRTGQASWLNAVHEHELRRPDGQRRFIQSNTFPIRTQRGFMVGAITRDVTAHRLAELELEQYRQHLEVMVAERTGQLQREIRERRQVEENLQVMLREVHHRVKNNLNVIIALIGLQKEAQTDSRVIAIFEDLQTRAYSMALVHESLYRSPNLAQVDFSSYLHTLVDYLRTAYVPHGFGQPVSLHVAVENVSLRIEAAVPCGLMVNELVTNAMKYAFPAGHKPCTLQGETLGEISVTLERGEGPTAGVFVLSVRDNGVGFPPEFDWRSAPTLGLQLVRVLARQLGGVLTLDTDSGLAWRFEFEERV